jgi:small subunit ribosomal protein S24e
MEVEIQSKTNNPLLKRTEVHFMVHHESEKTPKRELIQSELAEKLNVKKENIIVNFMKSSFGSADTVGYAKVYKSLKDAEIWEKKYALKRNNALKEEKKPIKKDQEKTVGKPPEKKEEIDDELKKKEPSVEQDAKEVVKKNEKTIEKTEESEKPEKDVTADGKKE